jgi:serine/threonine-protein kinase
MSPEQAAGKENLDGRSDVYGLGGVAYYLLTGQPPFVRDTAMQMLLAHAYEPVLPPRDVNPAVPADLQAVVLRCLHKDPAQRYPDAHSLEKALAACQDAGRWSEEQAAAWWQAHAADADTQTHPALTAPTQVTNA